MDKPIIFSAPMVKAILSGTKTQTRRIIKPQPQGHTAWQDDDTGEWWVSGHGEVGDTLLSLRWAPGDRLWVKEGFSVHISAGPVIHPKGDGHPWGSPIYKATFGAGLDPRCEGFSRWRPSIHMPRWASRITLAVKAVRVERLQDISEGDAIAEGVTADEDPFWRPSFADPDSGGRPSHRASFEYLWGHIHGPNAWDANPWVSVTTFRRVAA